MVGGKEEYLSLAKLRFRRKFRLLFMFLAVQFKAEVTAEVED